MSTRCFIGYKEKNLKVVKYVYCHFDGYPSGVGLILQECYNTVEKVKELVQKGNMSSLSTHIKGCDYYGDEPPVICSLEKYHFIEKDWIDYLYLFDEEKGAWFVEGYYGKQELSKVLSSLQIQEELDAIHNLYCSWFYGYRSIGSIYVPQRKAIDLTIWNKITENYETLSLPCKDKERAKELTENLVGKPFYQIIKAQHLECEYQEFLITPEDEIYDELKEKVKSKFEYGFDEKNLTLIGASYKDTAILDYFYGGLSGLLPTKECSTLILDYLNKKQNP